MKDGEKAVEAMKAKVRARLNKKRGGSIAEKLAEAQKNNPTNKLGGGAAKVEEQKARIRDLIKKRNEK